MENGVRKYLNDGAEPGTCVRSSIAPATAVDMSDDVNDRPHVGSRTSSSVRTVFVAEQVCSHCAMWFTSGKKHRKRSALGNV